MTKVQAKLNLQQRNTTCKTCGMSYFHHMEKDRALHTRYHSEFLNGPRWKIADTPTKVVRISCNKKFLECRIYTVGVTPRQVSMVEKLLKMVNQELNAPPAGEAWKAATEGDRKGRVFVAIVQDRVVGLCVTERIDADRQARWMVHRTQELVPNQTNKRSKIGISRIWVAPKWRKFGLAKQLLDVVLTHLVYGITFDKREVAFSQPSFAGGLLAKSFNGETHKSNEVLIPVYLED